MYILLRPQASPQTELNLHIMYKTLPFIIYYILIGLLEVLN